MSLFFYGAVELKKHKLEAIKSFQEIARKLNWNIQFDELQKEYNVTELFHLPETRLAEFIVFELKDGEEEVYTELYADYSGEFMTLHYRQLAQQLEIANWESLEFGSLDIVDAAYEKQPADIPCLKFMQKVFDYFPETEIIFCFDEGFENRFGCREVIGGKEELLQVAWLTIAFGYTWPNLRLKYQSEVPNKFV